MVNVCREIRRRLRHMEEFERGRDIQLCDRGHSLPRRLQRTVGNTTWRRGNRRDRSRSHRRTDLHALDRTDLQALDWTKLRRELNRRNRSLHQRTLPSISVKKQAEYLANRKKRLEYAIRYIREAPRRESIRVWSKWHVSTVGSKPMSIPTPMGQMAPRREHLSVAA